MDVKGVIGVVLCGFGRAGRIHFEGIRQNRRCQLKYIVDLLEKPQVNDLIQGTLAQYNLQGTKAVAVSAYEEILKDPTVHAVVVTTPTNQHEDYVRKGLLAGKAVFCEKPLAGSIQDIDACYDLAAKANRPLFCAFNRRFDDAMSSICKQVREGKVGKVYQIKTCSRDFLTPSMDYIKISGGMYHDSAVHDIDMICWILDEEPESVMTYGEAVDPEIKAVGDVDTIVIVLKFPSGVLGMIDLSRHCPYGYDQRLEVFGEKGMLVTENVLERPVQCYDKEGVHLPPIQCSFSQRYEKAYRKEMDHFIDAVLDPSISLSVTRRQTLLTSRVADACEQSRREGKIVTLT